MIHNISWPQYWMAVILTSLAYYLFIWVVYFKANLNFLKPQSVSLKESVNSGTDREDMNIILGDLEDAFDNRKNKNELILALKNKIQSYQEINDPGFRDSVNRFIISESLTKCSIRLEDDDLRTLWK